MPPLTLATTFPLSTLTDTAKVIGPICDVMGAVQSPTNGAARAGETIDPVVCAASRSVRYQRPTGVAAPLQRRR